MSTRSSIAVQAADGSIRMIYCHFDGYLEGVGTTLLENYTTLDAATALINMGDASSIGDDLDDSVFYGHDRNEDNVSAKRFTCYDEWINTANFQSYVYLFRDGQWFLLGRRSTMVLLRDAVIQEKLTG